MVAAIKFFLGVDQKDPEDEEKDPVRSVSNIIVYSSIILHDLIYFLFHYTNIQDELTVKDLVIQNKIAKKTKHRARKLNRAIEAAKRVSSQSLFILYDIFIS